MSPEDRPIRPLAAALALTLLVPVSAVAQGDPDAAWPSADELRLELQGIGYEFVFDGAGRSRLPEFNAGLPGLWTLTAPEVAGDPLPDGSGLDPFTLQLIDDGDAVQLLFAGASADGGEGEYEVISTVLMEIAARLPEGSGMDEAVWFIGNKWQNVGERTTAPCTYRDSEDSVMLAWFGGEGEAVTSFFGTVGPTAVLADELELCKQELDRLENAPAEEVPAAADVPAEPTVDYSVPPEEAADIIAAGGHVIIDVRTPAEYEQAHIVDAVNINVEGADFAQRIAELDSEAPYLLYCRSGRRSDLAAQQMAAAGFTDLTDAAGLADLARAGAPIE